MNQAVMGGHISSGGQVMPAAIGVVIFLVWAVMMLFMTAGYLIMLIAVWRISTAHKSIARSLEGISQKLDGKLNKQ